MVLAQVRANSSVASYVGETEVLRADRNGDPAHPPPVYRSHSASPEAATGVNKASPSCTEAPIRSVTSALTPFTQRQR